MDPLLGFIAAPESTFGTYRRGRPNAFMSSFEHHPAGQVPDWTLARTATTDSDPYYRLGHRHLHPDGHERSLATNYPRRFHYGGRYPYGGFESGYVTGVGGPYMFHRYWNPV